MRSRALAAVAVLCAPCLLADDLPVPPKFVLPRITQPITIDGDLSDPGWAEAAVIDTFYEFQPGDGTVLGLDIKWLPDAGTIVDATINPDFSQVESDVVQIGGTRLVISDPSRSVACSPPAPNRNREKKTRPTGSGSRPGRSARTRGRSKSGSRCRRCAIPTRTRRTGH